MFIMNLGASLAMESVYNMCKRIVVKIICFTDDDKQCGFFNGFFYHDTEPYILTCGHSVRFGGATKYKALLPDGNNDLVDIQLTKQWHVVAVFTFSYGLNRCPFATTAAIGDIVFVVGFGGCDERQPMLVQGIVSYDGMRGMTIVVCNDNNNDANDNNDDNGFSTGCPLFPGCPLFNVDGFIVGMVVGEDLRGTLTKTQHVEAIHAMAIHTCL